MSRKRFLTWRVVFVGLITVLAVVPIASADRRPSDDQIAFAGRVSDLMLNELVAALFQEFDETTPDNVAEGKQAISLIFNDGNRNMRLIGTFAPPQGGNNDPPSDRFERQALQLALPDQHVRRLITARQRGGARPSWPCPPRFAFPAPATSGDRWYDDRSRIESGPGSDADEDLYFL